MSITLERLRPFLLKSNINESVLIDRIHKFQDHYTTSRDKLKGVTWDEFDVSSYACFYLATNYQKFDFVLKHLPKDFFNPSPNKKIEVIDFGTGPGTYLLSYLDKVSFENTKCLIGIDKSELMLKQAKALLHGLFPEIKNKIILRDTIPAKDDGVERVVIFGNSINEMDSSLIEKNLKLLNADKVIFIEPGTPPVYNKLMELREFFKKSDFHCHYPCPSLEKSCPIQEKIKDGMMDWCHQVWRGRHEDCVERLSQMVKIDRKVMPLIAHVYSKKAVFNNQANCRFIRFLGESKHSFNWQVCLLESSDTEMEIVDFEIPKKTMPKKVQKEFKKLSVGLEVNYKVIKKSTLINGESKLKMNFFREKKL